MQILQRLPDGRMVAHVFYYAQDEDGRWITLDNGQHVFVKEGESVGDAIQRLKPDGKVLDPSKEKVKITNKLIGRELYTQKIRDKLEELPSEHVKLIKEIEVVSNAHWDDDLEVKEMPPVLGVHVGGEWIKEEGKIYLNGDYLWRDLSSGTLQHEVGHAVYNSLPKNDQDDWYNFWYNNREKMPTWNAKGRNAPEGFCDSYKYYQRHMDTSLDSSILSWFKRNKVARNE